jgi:hypothetical protein
MGTDFREVISQGRLHCTIHANAITVTMAATSTSSQEANRATEIRLKIVAAQLTYHDGFVGDFFPWIISFDVTVSVTIRSRDTRVVTPSH